MNFRVLPVTPFQQNCTLLIAGDNKTAAIIDPGGDVDRILALIEKADVELQLILLTHGHIDHVGGARQLADRLQLPIWGPHKDDDFWLQQLTDQSAMFGLKTSGPFEPDRWLEDGDQVEVGDLTLDVLHCPGHTPGHVIFIEREQRWAQVGDVLFRGSIGRSDFPRGDHNQLVSSIREKLFPLGDDVQFVPGHGPMSTFGEERRSNPFVADPKYR